MSTSTMTRDSAVVVDDALEVKLSSNPEPATSLENTTTAYNDWPNDVGVSMTLLTD